MSCEAADGTEPDTGKTGFAMSNRRSYLETLNAGRERRADAPLDGLNRSLDMLERRLRDPAADDHGAARSRLSAERRPERRPDSGAGRDGMLREIEMARDHEDNVAAAGRIAGEIRTMRDEFRSRDDRQLRRAEDMQGEFEALRREMARAPKLDAELVAEFDRLSGAIQGLSEKGDDRGTTLLRLELEQLKGALDSLAREDSLRSVASRWDALDDRLGAFEAKLGDTRGSRAGEAKLAELDGRLDDLHRAVAALPTSNSMKGFEENLRALAVVVDQFARDRDGIRPDALQAIEERMDQLSRAVSAAARSPAPLDPKPFERIEARVSAVSQQVEAWRAEGSSDAIMHRLSQLSARVDELAAKANLPGKAVESLAHQVAIIADKLDRVGAVPDPDFVFKGIEQRFETLAAMLERRQGDAASRADMLFRDLERRLDEVVERLDSQPSRDAAEQNRVIAAALDARFEDFARRFEGGQKPAADGKLIRSLEEQIKVLADHLARPTAGTQALDAIAPRLEGLERSLSDHMAGQGDRIVAAAREAAENAVRSLSAASGPEREAVAGLAHDLKTLEALNRRSDERNAKTFEAIHDTLIKIVERLGALDAQPARPPARMPVADAPSLDLDRPLPIERPSQAAAVLKRQAAAAPAPAATLGEAALLDAVGGEPVAAAETPRRRSMLGNLSRALGRGRAESAEPLAAAREKHFDLDEPLDPKIANRPLEPGSGTPDLGAIMRRVRDERAQAQQVSNEADAAKSDFIAAARRAAQAAAAEAEIAKKGSIGSDSGSKSKLGAMLRRKTVLMAVGAIMIALAGFQAVRPLLADAEPQAVAETEMPQLAPAPTAEASQQAAVAMPEAPPPVAPPAAEVAEAPAMTMPMPAPETEAEAVPPSQDVTAATAAMEVPAAIEPAALREAAQAGDAKALWEVATRFATGKHVPSDKAQAAKWFEAAADLGLAPAQYRVGSLYEKGVGVARDLAKAKAWYLKAADAGNVSAMHNLAVLYAMGADGAADNESAVKWFTAAAEHGVKDSQFNLGILAAKGVGMGQDLESSYKWFSIVARTGDADAAAKRDEIAKSLKPEQMKRAKATTELWKVKPADPEANTVEIPDSWSDGDAPASTASVDMKAAVRTIQLILEKNGYAPGGTDGVMGARTKSAIIAFQKDSGLAPSGEVDDKLVKALLAKK